MRAKQSSVCVVNALLLVTLAGCSKSNFTIHKGLSKSKLQPDVIGAVDKKYVVTLKALLDTGLVDVNGVDEHGNGLLTHAISNYENYDPPNRDVAVLDLLLAAGADPNAGRDLPLVAAAEMDSPEAVRVLIKYGAKVNISGEDGFTPLLAALPSGRRQLMDVVHLLLDNGADVNAKEKEHGYSALMLACSEHRADGEAIVRTLLEHGADVNATDVNGETALSVPLNWCQSDQKVRELLSSRMH
jgi:ankyrin repeat protein